MKKYIAPEMTVSLFDGESIVTLSEQGKTSAFETAKSTFVGMGDNEHIDVAHTFIVDLGE